jgi:quercetin dioxygenase-like cupin family protein
MRLFVHSLVGAGLALASSMAASADPPDIHVDVPGNAKGLEVNVVEQDFAPSQGTGWHKHAGYEIAYVLSGAVNVTIGASPIRHVAQGDTFEVERATPHEVTNASTTAPAALLITFLKDRKAPLMIPAQPPAIH